LFLQRKLYKSATSEKSVSGVEYKTEAFELPCTVATTNLQQNPDAEPKKAVSAKSYGR
jgi:hypothetical protein